MFNIDDKANNLATEVDDVKAVTYNTKLKEALRFDNAVPTVKGFDWEVKATTRKSLTSITWPPGQCRGTFSIMDKGKTCQGKRKGN